MKTYRYVCQVRRPWVIQTNSAHRPRITICVFIFLTYLNIVYVLY